MTLSPTKITGDMINGGALSVDSLSTSGVATFNGNADISGNLTVNSVDLTPEEGTFNPIFIGSTTAGTPTYSVQEGFYIKIGDMVFISGRVAITALGSISGNIRLGGIPFSVAGQSTAGVWQDAGFIGRVQNFTGVSNISVGNFVTTTSFLALYIDSGTTVVTDSELTTSSHVRFAGWYRTG